MSQLVPLSVAIEGIPDEVGLFPAQFGPPFEDVDPNRLGEWGISVQGQNRVSANGLNLVGGFRTVHVPGSDGGDVRVGSIVYGPTRSVPLPGWRVVFPAEDGPSVSVLEFRDPLDAAEWLIGHIREHFGLVGSGGRHRVW